MLTVDLNDRGGGKCELEAEEPDDLRLVGHAGRQLVLHCDQTGTFISIKYVEGRGRTKESAAGQAALR
jgi:hypothetical protein